MTPNHPDIAQDVVLLRAYVEAHAIETCHADRIHRVCVAAESADELARWKERWNPRIQHVLDLCGTWESIHKEEPHIVGLTRQIVMLLGFDPMLAPSGHTPPKPEVCGKPCGVFGLDGHYELRCVKDTGHIAECSAQISMAHDADGSGFARAVLSEEKRAGRGDQHGAQQEPRGRANPFDEINRKVSDAGDVLTVSMGDLKEAIGAGRLGVWVRKDIVKELERRGLAFVGDDDLPENQREHVRIFRRGTGVADLIKAVLEPNSANDEVIRRKAGGNKTTAEEILQQVKRLVCD